MRPDLLNRRSLLNAGCLTGAGLFLGCEKPGGPNSFQFSNTVGGSADSSLRDDALVRSDWPALFGPFRTSRSDENFLLDSFSEQGPERLWSYPIGEGYSSPVTHQNRLVLHHRKDDQEVLEALDAATGEPLWRRAHPTTFQCRFEYSSGPYSTPVLGDDQAVAISAEGEVRCVRVDDGELIWWRSLAKEFDTPQQLFAFGATPLRVEERLILNAGGRSGASGIIALDWRTGNTLWTVTEDASSYATPVAARIHNTTFVFVTTYEGLTALDPSDGSICWRIPFRPKSPDTINATSPVVFGDRVLAVTGPGPGAICLRVRPDGKFDEVWRDRRVLDSQFNTLIALDEFVYGFTAMRQGGARLRCVDVRNGRLQWEWASELQRGTGLAADGKLILWGEKGHLALLDADPLRLRVRSMTKQPLLQGPCYSAPALAGGRLYLRNEKQLLCLQFSAV